MAEDLSRFNVDPDTFWLNQEYRFQHKDVKPVTFIHGKSQITGDPHLVHSGKPGMNHNALLLFKNSGKHFFDKEEWERSKDWLKTGKYKAGPREELLRLGHLVGRIGNYIEYDGRKKKKQRVVSFWNQNPDDFDNLLLALRHLIEENLIDEDTIVASSIFQPKRVKDYFSKFDAHRSLLHDPVFDITKMHTAHPALKKQMMQHFGLGGAQLNPHKQDWKNQYFSNLDPSHLYEPWRIGDSTKTPGKTFNEWLAERSCSRYNKAAN